MHSLWGGVVSGVGGGATGRVPKSCASPLRLGSLGPVQEKKNPHNWETLCTASWVQCV